MFAQWWLACRFLSEHLAAPMVLYVSSPHVVCILMHAGDRESSVSFTSSDGCAAIEAERLAGDLALDLVWTTPDDVPEGDDNTSSSHHPEQDQTPSPLISSNYCCNHADEHIEAKNV